MLIPFECEYGELLIEVALMPPSKCLDIDEGVNGDPEIGSHLLQYLLLDED